MGTEGNGMEWNGMERNGRERNGIELAFFLPSFLHSFLQSFLLPITTYFLPLLLDLLSLPPIGPPI